MIRKPNPLQWPEGWRRTPKFRRVDSQFRDRPFTKIRAELVQELERFGARQIVLTSDLPTRKDGLPYANTRQPDDPGVAVFFMRRRAVGDPLRPFALASDGYRRVWENIHAITHTIRALRALDRHGCSEILERAVSGFAELPPAPEDRPWSEVLGISSGAPFPEIQAAVRRRLLETHPDRGGLDADFRAVVRASEQAAAARGES